MNGLEGLRKSKKLQILRSLSVARETQRNLSSTREIILKVSSYWPQESLETIEFDLKYLLVHVWSIQTGLSRGKWSRSLERISPSARSGTPRGRIASVRLKPRTSLS